jgi:hypothetical protein
VLKRTRARIHKGISPFVLNYFRTEYFLENPIFPEDWKTKTNVTVTNQCHGHRDGDSGSVDDEFWIGFF